MKDFKSKYLIYKKKYINYKTVINQYGGLLDQLGKWKDLIQHLLNNKYNIYIFGESVLGIQMLKMLFESNTFIKSDKKLEMIIENFDKLQLFIKYEFIIYLSIEEVKKIFENNSSFRMDENNVFRMIGEMKSFDGESLIHLEFAHKDEYYDCVNLDIPMMSMKILINDTILENLFHFIRMVHQFSVEKKKKILDIEFLLQFTRQIQIYQNKAIDGFFDVCDNIDEYNYSRKCVFNKDDIKPELLEIMEDTIDNLKITHNELVKKCGEKNILQFLINQFSEPDRMFVKMIQKYFNKTKIIEQYLLKLGIAIKSIDWMLNYNFVYDINYMFVSNLSERIQQLFVLKYEENYQMVNDLLILYNKIKCENATDIDKLNDVIEQLINTYGNTKYLQEELRILEECKLASNLKDKEKCLEQFNKTIILGIIMIITIFYAEVTKKYFGNEKVKVINFQKVSNSIDRSLFPQDTIQMKLVRKLLTKPIEEMDTDKLMKIKNVYVQFLLAIKNLQDI
jgi:hypothetical protein